jgi:hypothetical protein
VTSEVIGSSPIIHPKQGQVTQLVECQTENLEVVGSVPTLSTIHRDRFNFPQGLVDTDPELKHQFIPMAKLNKAAVYETGECRFDSCSGYQIILPG